MACETLSARKKIQVKQVSAKVITMLITSLRLGVSLPRATTSKLCRFLPAIKSGKKNNAFRNPQITKVQLAPCQKPLSKKMTKVFLIFIHNPPLLPPSGM